MLTQCLSREVSNRPVVTRASGGLRFDRQTATLQRTSSRRAKRLTLSSAFISAPVSISFSTQPVCPLVTAKRRSVQPSCSHKRKWQSHEQRSELVPLPTTLNRNAACRLARSKLSYLVFGILVGTCFYQRLHDRIVTIFDSELEGRQSVLQPQWGPYKSKGRS